MRILSRYMLASYLSLFVGILLSAMAAIMVIELLLNFDDILDHHKGMGGVANYFFFRIPSYYLKDLLPVTSFAASFFCIGLLARGHEITAIKSGGISPRRPILAVLGAAAFLSVLTLGVSESLVLEASRQWNRLTSPGDEIAFRRGSFWYARGQSIYNVEEADAATRTLFGVSVFELSDTGRLLRSIRAERVVVADDSHWKLFDVTTRRFDPNQPASPPRTEFMPEWDRDMAAERDLTLLEASANTLSLADLRDYIAAQAREGRDTERQRAQFHGRLAEPLNVFLFALLAVPLGLAVEQSRSLAVSALQGIVLIAVFYTVRTTAGLFAAAGVAAASSSPWLILAAFGGYGAWQLSRSPR